MKALFLIFCALLVSGVFGLSAPLEAELNSLKLRQALQPDHYDVCDQVRVFNLDCEHYAVPTPDGFLLDMIHIPPLHAGAYPIILQHGLLDCAAAFLFNAQRQQNLATALHDAGYDVWMPNSRGNHYSMNNTKHSQKSSDYWEGIDMDEMAQYDVPANIDLVLNVSNQSTLTFIGHSQGSWQALTSFGNHHKELSKKVDLFIGLAPAVHVGHSTSLLGRIITALDLAEWAQFFGIKEILANDWLLRQLGQYCDKMGPLCPGVIELICGDGNIANTNRSRYGVYLRYGPAGTSVNNIVHWTQSMRKSTYQAHDYGLLKNLQKY